MSIKMDTSMQHIRMFEMLKDWGEQPNAESSPSAEIKPGRGNQLLSNWSKMQNHSAKSPEDLGDISKEAMMFSYAKAMHCQ